MQNFKLGISALALSISLVCSSAAHAQLDEIVVTAQKKEESIQDAPLSVTAYSAEALENQGIATLTDLSVQAPSLQFYDFPTSTSNISLFLRGFGNTDSQTLTIDNPVGLYVDGVYIARTSGATLDVLDLERVEILRGPQGTLFGRNSSAGAVNFITKAPASETSGSVYAGIGNYGQLKAGATVNLPVSESVRLKGSVGISEFGGWVDNEGPNNAANGNDFYQNDQIGFRLTGEVDIASDVTARYTFDRSESDGSAPYYQQNAAERQTSTTNFLAGGFVSSVPWEYELPESNTTTSGHNLTVDWEIGENLALKSITAFRTMEELAIQNWSDTLFFATTVDWETEAFSQEFQLSGSAADDQLEFIFGAYHFEEDGNKAEEQFTNGVSFAPDALAAPLVDTSILMGGNNLGIHTVDTELTSQAVFGQATYSPNGMDNRLDLTLGLRYTDDDREAIRGVDAANPSIQFQPGSNSLSYSRLDYTAVADYALSDNVNAYVRTATGYRAGGSGERTLNFGLTFDEEESTSYEVGFKSELFDRRLRLNAALFTTDYDNLILTISGLPPIDTPMGQTLNLASFVENVNAGQASTTGLEVDVTTSIADNGFITLNYAYVDSELSDVIVPQGSFLLSGFPAGPVDLRGQDISATTFIAQAPEHAFSAAFDYGVPLSNGMTLDLHANYSWRDEVLSQPSLGLPVKSLGLLGARVALSDISVGEMNATLSIWGKNLTDEEKIVYDLSTLGFQYTRPTTYGVDLKVNF